MNDLIYGLMSYIIKISDNHYYFDRDYVNMEISSVNDNLMRAFVALDENLFESFESNLKVARYNYDVALRKNMPQKDVEKYDGLFSLFDSYLVAIKLS